MINRIAIEGFKSFGLPKDMRFAQITILYGKNGRGKSSIVQPMLLLSQTMQAKGEPNTLLVNGSLVQLGVADDLINYTTKPGRWVFEMSSDAESLKIGYGPMPGKPQLAAMCAFEINGENRFSSVVSSDGSDPAVPDQDRVSVTTSDSSILQNLKNLTYVSSERRGPCNEVKLNDNLDADNIGVRGETVINVIHNRGKEFAREVSGVLSYVLDGGAVSTLKEGEDRISMRINSTDDEDVLFKPVNVGFGYSYVLPVIVATLLAKSESMLIIENPEAHLHPAAQSRLMKFIMGQAKERNFQAIIETHSDHVVNGLRIARKGGEISRKDALILFVEHDRNSLQTAVEEIECDNNGTLSKEPDDFMDEWTKQLLDLM